VLRSAHPEDTDDAAAAISGRHSIADEGITSVRWTREKPLGESALCTAETVEVSRKPEQDVGGIPRARFRDAPEASLDLGGPEDGQRSVERVLRVVDLAAGQSAAEPVARSSRCGGLDP
jgi:hypothetical protein